MKPITLQTRREFLRSTLLGGALTWTIPGFLANTFAALQSEAANGSQPLTGRDGAILVLLQMAGGNDGLNTVVPFANDDYRRARPRLALSPDKVLKLNDELGLHPSLTGLKALYDAGRLAIVQGVGYPNPNRSHFRSTEIWQTASDSKQVESYGWVGRYFDNACAGCDPTVGISLGRQLPQAFVASHSKGISLDNPQNFRFLPPRGAAPAEIKQTEASYRKLNQLDDDLASTSGATIGALPGASAHRGSALEFLERTALDAQVSSDTIRSVAARGANLATYPPSQLGASLKLVSRLIAGGLPTRIFYVSQGGYDTHANQLGAQERLLKDLGLCIQAFTDDLRQQGNLSRVLLMTFSEFGRRVAENANGGTDHGAAAPLFIVGEKSKGGVFGTQPSCAPADLWQGDLRFQIDFRSVYATVLERWLQTSSLPILGRNFPLLAVI